MFIRLELRKVRKYLLVGCTVVLLLTTAWFAAGEKPQETAGKEAVELPVIMYHHLSENSQHLGEYVLSPAALEQDFQYIRENGYTAVTVEDLINYVYESGPLPEKPIMITFDDGYESFYVYAYPLLQKYEMKAVLSIIGIQADIYSAKDEHNIAYSHATWSQIKEMNDSGLVEIQNHSYNMHSNTGDRHGSKIKNDETVDAYTEVLKSDLFLLQEKIKEHTGVTPTAYSYPFGSRTLGADIILQSLGFQATLGTFERLNYITKNPETLYSIRRFNRPAGPSAADFFQKIYQAPKTP